MKHGIESEYTFEWEAPPIILKILKSPRGGTEEEPTVEKIVRCGPEYNFFSDPALPHLPVIQTIGSEVLPKTH